jgi:DNA (cytosine-5)-methyltransferase 1
VSADLDVVSLFAGVGGIDLAAHRAGMTTRLLCEVDAPCRAVLARRFPDAVIHPDVRTLTVDDLRAAGAVPARTVVTAGWPCQGNSVAGRRQGMADARSGLWSEVARLLAEFRPAWFVGENVPGLLSVDGGWDFATVIGDLASLGYGVAWRVLDAQYTGVPQRRRRVVLVGHLGDTGAASAEILLEPEGGGRDHPPLREAGEGVAGTLGGGSGNRGWSPDTDRMAFVPVTAATLTAGVSGRGVSAPGRRQEDDVNLVTVTGPVTHALTAEGSDASEDGTGRGAPIIAFAWQAGGNDSASGAFQDDGTTPCLPRSQTLAVAIQDGRDMEKAQNGVGIGEPGDPAYTLDTMGAQAALTPDEVRRLTPLECERLQGFPDGWTEGQSDAARYKQMGNSVAVPVFSWVLSRLAAVDARLSERAA